MTEEKPIKVQKFIPVMSFETVISLMRWGHVKDGRIYIGRHRARCTAKALGFGPEKCNIKLDLKNIGAYYPKIKQIHCKLCQEMSLWHEMLDNELVIVSDKKTLEEQIIDKLIEERII